jgi:hypothetical protein
MCRGDAAFHYAYPRRLCGGCNFFIAEPLEQQVRVHGIIVVFGKCLENSGHTRESGDLRESHGFCRYWEQQEV